MLWFQSSPQIIIFVLFCPHEQTLGDSEGQGSLVCFSPWGHKKSYETEWLNNKARSRGFPGGKNPPASAGDSRDVSLIPESGRSPGVGSGNHSSVLAWKILWIEEPDGHDCVCTHIHTHTTHTYTLDIYCLFHKNLCLDLAHIYFTVVFHTCSHFKIFFWDKL